MFIKEMMGAIVSYLTPKSQMTSPDAYHAFIKKRQHLLMELVSQVTQHPIPNFVQPAEEGEDLSSSIARDSGNEVAEADD